MIKFTAALTGMLLCLNLAFSAQKNYCGAELFSNETIKYGRFDVRMRTISGSGTVSSFFLYYNNSYLGSPEPWREIDIEVLGKSSDVFQSNIITGNATSKITSEKLHTFSNLATAYHTYSILWTPDYIAWLFDGNEVRRTTGSQVSDCQLKEMSYRFNLWISDQPAWVGAFNESILPVNQYLNYLKYSKYTPGSGPNGSDFTPEWTDNFDSFNSSRWSKASHTFDGNLVDFSPNNVVTKDGYCILCLTKANQTGFNGSVPVDQEQTSIIKTGKFEIVNAVPNVNYSNNQKSVFLSLNGKTVQQRMSGNCNGRTPISTGLWVRKQNNSQSIYVNMEK